MSDPVLVEMLEAVYTFLKKKQKPKKGAVGFRWTVTVGRTVFRFKGDGNMLLITDVQKVSMAIQPVDAHGHPAKIDGVPEWGLSDATLGTLEVAADGLSATFISGDQLGLVQVTVSADADLGDGMRTISGTLDIQIEAGEAVSLSIVAGVPEPK